MNIKLYLLVLVSASGWVNSAFAQVTAFSYQGRLAVNGVPANGLYGGLSAHGGITLPDAKFSGNGAGLTALPAAQLVGKVPNAALSGASPAFNSLTVSNSFSADRNGLTINVPLILASGQIIGLTN